MKNFIVPIDFSDDSLNGLELAMLFAQKTHVNIQMVYILMKSSDLYKGPALEEKKLAEKKFESIIKEYTPRLGKESHLRYIIKSGKIYEEIVNQAHSYKESIITTSTHGASGFEELFIGSNAFKILSATDRPVITIRKGHVPKDFKRIVMPVDTSPETRQKVVLVAEIAQLFKSEVHIVPTSTSKNKEISKKLSSYTRQMTKYLESAGIPYKTEPIFGSNPVDMVIDYSNLIGADLITIVTDEASAFSGLFMSSLAHQVISKSSISVLNIKPSPIHLPRDFSTFGG
jgi:nucleotide-binding universal stress UspA family protein